MRIALTFAMWLMPVAAWADAPPPQTLILAAPDPILAGPDCMRLDARLRASGTQIALDRSFYDGFDSFVRDDNPQGGAWTPHYSHNAYDDWRARTLANNQERQIYVDPGYQGDTSMPLGLDPFTLKDGVLTISGQPVPDALRDDLHGFDYMSGMLNSDGQFQQLHGYFEIRARLPAGQGIWPAFWLLRPGMWPPEIDVMEMLGHAPDRFHGTVHWDGDSGKAASGCTNPVADATTRFRSYGVLWTDRMIVHYLDRQPVSVIETKPGMDGPMYLLANLAIGGKWPGLPDATTPFPARYDIDWIVAYAWDGTK